MRLHGVAPTAEAERLAWRRRTACVFQEPLLCRGQCSTTPAWHAVSAVWRAPRPTVARGTRLGRLGIAALADRPVDRLSGGEAQRTSLARAFAAMPEILFLDEPFAALDAPTREALLDDLGRLLAATETTTVLVTHDRAEALRLGYRVAILLEGRLAQMGPPAAVFGAPAGEAVARFVGVENLPAGTRGGRDRRARRGGRRPGAVDRRRRRIGERVLIGCRPGGRITLAPAGIGGHQRPRRLVGRIVRVAPLVGSGASGWIAGCR